ncbi:MAG: hypothetical protein ACD_79C00146G0002 [uncultured bacterium]|nr:MAG: hypothetical protein ACD_79C00146G0002 [uncultured bacterium]
MNYLFSEELIQLNQNMKKQRGLFTYNININFKFDFSDTSLLEVKSDEVNPDLLDDIRIEYPELFTTDWFLTNACKKTNSALRKSLQ